MKAILVCVAVSAMACGVVPSAPSPDAGHLVEAADAGAAVDAGVAQTKLLFAFDTSESLSITDSQGARATALIDLISGLPSETSWSVMLFSGKTVRILTDPARFQPLSALTDTERANLVALILQSRGDGATDFKAPLEFIKGFVAADIARGGRNRFDVVFVTDGAPSVNQDADLLCNGVVSGIADLSDSQNSVRVNTAHLFRVAVLPACTDSFTETLCEVAPPASMCLAGVVGSYQARLQKMATLGRGQFKAFTDLSVAVDYSVLLSP